MSAKRLVSIHFGQCYCTNEQNIKNFASQIKSNQIKSNQIKSNQINNMLIKNYLQIFYNFI